jgi:hypothetical protein
LHLWKTSDGIPSEQKNCRIADVHLAMNALQVQISVLIGCLIAIVCGNAEEEASKERSAPFKIYYAACKGIEPKGGLYTGRFELQKRWDYYEGLKPMDTRVVSIPIMQAVGSEGWLQFEPEDPTNWHFWEIKKGHQRDYPDPFLWYNRLDGTYFDATVSSVAQAEGGHTKVELLIFSKKVKDGSWTRDKPRGSVSIIWENSGGPVPVTAGQHVRSKISASREVLMIEYGSGVRLWRKAADGLVGIAVGTEEDPKGDKLGLLFLKPTGINGSQEDVHWFPRFGVFLFDEDAGGGGYEPESLKVSVLGIPIRNVPGLRIHPGREGWRTARRSSDGFWEDKIELPDAQTTWGAG